MREGCEGRLDCGSLVEFDCSNRCARGGGGSFGGVKKSGLGREMGMQVLDHYTEWKTVYMDVSK